MPLQWEKLYIPATHGFAQHEDYHTRPPHHLDVINGMWAHNGDIVKRYGFARLASTVSTESPAIDSPRVIFSTGNELCMYDERRLYARDVVNDIWIDRGPIAPATGRSRVLFAGERSFTMSDSHTDLGNSFRLNITLFEQQEDRTGATIAFDQGIMITIDGLDDETNRRPLTNQFFAFNTAITNWPTAPRATAAGAYLVAAYVLKVGARAGELYFYSWDTGNSEAVVACGLLTQLVDCPNDQRPYDMCPITSGAQNDKFAVVYIEDTTFDLQYEVRSPIPPGAAAVVATLDNVSNWKLCAICEDPVTSDRCYVMAVESSSPEVIHYGQIVTSTGAWVWGPSVLYNVPSGNTINNIGVASDGTEVVWTWGRLDGVWDDPDMYSYMGGRRTNTTGTVLGVQDDVPSCIPTSQPWYNGGRAYVAAQTTCSVGALNTGQPDADLFFAAGVRTVAFDAGVVFSIDGLDDYIGNGAESPNMVGVYAVGSHGIVAQSLLGSANSVSATTDPARFQWTYPVQTLAFSTVDDSANPVVRTYQNAQHINEMRFDEWGLPAVAAQGSAIIGGSMLAWYDGNRTTEVGWVNPPIYDNHTLQVLGAFATLNGGGAGGGQDYTWTCTYEVHDASGVLHRSLPGLPVKITVPNPDNAITLQASAPGATNRKLQNWSCVWYRASATAIFQRITGASRVLDYTSGSSSINCLTMTDFGQGALYNLYTTGGILENVAPEGARIPVVANGRVWLGDFWARSRLQYSKPFAPGTAAETEIAPEFNEGFGMTLPGGQRITGLAELDESVVAFTAGEVYLVSGEGPDDTGAANTFSPLQLLSNDVGCIEPRSVLATPEGVFFQAPRGIYLLDRSHQIKFAGEPAIDTMAAYPYVSGAALMPEHNLAIWCVTSGVVGKGAINARLLVYDYRVRQWSLWLTYKGSPSTTTAPISVCRHQGQLFVLTDDGNVWRWNTLTHYDDTTEFVPLLIESSWVLHDKVGGWQRMRKASALCSRVDHHDLTMEVRNDYESATSQSHTWPEATITAMPQPAVRLQTVARVRRQKCQALKLRLYDEESGSTTNGAGYSFHGFALEVGRKRGAVKVQKGQRI